MTPRALLYAITAWIKALWRRVPDHLQEYSHKALQITRALRDTLNSGIADVAVTLIPGEWDNELRDKAVKLLNAAVLILQQIDGEADLQDAVLIKTAAKLTAFQDANKLPQNRYDLIAQVAFSAQKKEA